MARQASRFAPLSNWVLQSAPMRAYLEMRYGLDRRVPPPRFVWQTFRAWQHRHARRHAKARSDGTRPEVVYFVDTWTNYAHPEVGKATVEVLEAMGYDVVVPPALCCGRPLISKGFLAEAKALAEQNVRLLAPYAARGVPIVGTEPSCILTFLDEVPRLVPGRPALWIAQQAAMVESFVSKILARMPDALSFAAPPAASAVADASAYLYHAHCHQKALVGTEDANALLAACTGNRSRELSTGCCGMAGSFGHEKAHYDIARAIGEQRLFPAVRDRGAARMVVSGFSCRHQIMHHTGADARHVMEVVRSMLAPRAAQHGPDDQAIP